MEGSSKAHVSLLIDGLTFNVKKEVLCEHSDYFRAMFSGSYVENEQNEVKIDVIDADSMRIIMQYMTIGLIDLSGFSLQSMNDLAMAANFLQMTEFIRQIEYTLEIQLSISNWIEILTIAENVSYVKLERLAAAFGLFSFKSMEPEDIPSIHLLFWYLSHPYLDTRSEFDVFKFAYIWIQQHETGADALMIILGCLDLSKLRNNDLIEIKKIMSDYEISLAAKVVDCLLEITSAGNNELTMEVITQHKDALCEMFTERVYREVINLARESKSRGLSSTLVPIVPVWIMKDAKPEFVPHNLYTFNERNGFEKWLEVADRNLWGWSVTSWGLWKLVVVCGEHGRGTGNFMRDIRVYDTLRNEWLQHGVELPPRRHGGVAVIGNSLYIVGGVGGFRSVCLIDHHYVNFAERVVLDTVIVYDMNERSFRHIASLPDAIQSPAVCVHEDTIYAAGHNNIYKYEDLGESDRWVRVVSTELMMSCMVSYKGSIYCTQNFFSYLYVFKPGVHDRLEMINCFSNPPAAVCNLDNRLLFFTRNMCGQTEILNNVEEYTAKNIDEEPKLVWSHTGNRMKVNEVAGACSLVLTLPPLYHTVSHYHKTYLDRYIDLKM